MGQKRFQYQRQDCPLTLREGLEEYYQGHPGLFRQNTLSPESAQFFHSHDICHVLFGLDTTLRDEGLADTWTVLGTSLGARRYAKILRANPEANNLLKELGIWAVVRTGIEVLPSLLRVFFRSRRMNQKWPWAHEDEFLDVPLAKLREEFTLHIL